MDVEANKGVEEANKSNLGAGFATSSNLESSTEDSGNKLRPPPRKLAKCKAIKLKKNQGPRATSQIWDHFTRVEGSVVNVEEMRKELAEMIMVDGLPFSIVEGEGFRSFYKAMQPRFTVPSRVTIARDCMKLYHEEKLRLKRALKSQRVCLTTDTWSSIQNLNYVCITAHWIDNDWNLHKKILNFCQVPDHKGETIGKTVEKCLLDWGIDGLFTITVDNASSNDGAINYLKRRTRHWKGTILEYEFLHLRCCAHIIKFIVKEGLDDLNESILKIRNAVRYVRSSSASLQTFKKCVKIQMIESNNLLCLDVETRWDSTYLMLDVAEKFEKAFQWLGDDDPGYFLYFDGAEDENEEGGSGGERGKGRGNRNIGPPSEDDWKNARFFVNFLKLFYNVTLRFSSSLHVTSNAFLHELVLVHIRLVQLCKSGDALLSSVAERMKRRFDKYWENFDNLNFVLYVAIVLDPRYKLRFVKYCFGKIYDSFMAQDMTTRVEATFTRLYEHYLRDSNPNVGSCSSIQAFKEVDIDENEEDYMKLLRQYGRHLEEEENVKSKSEVVRYLGESCEKNSDSFDILGWWKLNSPKYPILSQVARDVLAIPVSTVASESVFSTNGNILDPYRSSLSPKMVEAVICGQNWLRSKPIPIDMREALEELERYKKIELEFGGSRITAEPMVFDY